MATAPWTADTDQQPMAGGAYTSGGPAPTGSTYQQYTPQTFAQQSQAQAFGAPQQSSASSMTAWPTGQQQGQQAAQPQSWAAQTANWQQNAQPQVPFQSQGYTPTGYNPAGQTQVSAATAPPPGGWGAQWGTQPQQAPAAGGSAAQQIQAAYQQYLGRAATAQEVQAQLAQPNLQRQIASIASSQEAYNRYLQQQQQPQGGQQQQQGGPQAQTLDPRRWNTDGYTPPRYIAQRVAGHPMPGWDRAKWADPNHQTPKYVIGRLLSGFKPRTSNMDAVVAEIAKAYPGARRTGSGDVTIPGVGSVDILKAADVGGKAWHFGSLGGGKAPAAQAPQQPAYDPYAQLGQVLQNYTQQAPPQAAPPQQDPAQAQQIAEMQQQLQLFQQQAATQQQQAAAAEAAARNRGPQFSYY